MHRSPGISLPPLLHPAFLRESPCRPFRFNAEGQYIIQVLDGNGSVVRQLTGLPGNPVIPVNLHGLRFIYTVKVTTATDVATAKLLVL